MSDPKRHTRVTAELAAFTRSTQQILRHELLDLLDETVPEDGVMDVESIDAPVHASNMYVRRASPVAVTDHERPTLRQPPLVRPTDD